MTCAVLCGDISHGERPLSKDVSSLPLLARNAGMRHVFFPCGHAYDAYFETLP